MYRPVHSTRREHAKELLHRAGYADGGPTGIEPMGVPGQEPAIPGIAPKSLPPPISTNRRLGRRARSKFSTGAI